MFIIKSMLGNEKYSRLLTLSILEKRAVSDMKLHSTTAAFPIIFIKASLSLALLL